MNFVSRRPLFTAAMIFLLTGVLAYYIDLRMKMVGIAMLFAALVVIFAFYIAGIIRHKGYSFTRLFVVLIFPAVFSLCLSYLYFDLYVGRTNEYIGKSAHVEAYVTESTYKSDHGTISAIRITSIDGERKNINATLYTDFECDMSEYDSISLDVVFSELSDDELGFSEKKYNLSKGRIISADALKNSVTIISHGDGGSAILRALRSFSKSCSARLSVILGDTDGGFASALLLGDKSGLEADLKRDFGRLGLSHMLAISGMHLSVLSYALEKLLVRLYVKKKQRCFVMIPATIVFAGITGFSMSVLRASIMLIIYYLGFFLSGERDSLTSLAVSCAAICIAMPNAVLDCGLQLSFSATLGLIIAGKLMPKELQKPEKQKHKILQRLLLTVMAVLFTLPLMWLYFGEVSIISPITNLIFCIPITLVLYISPLLLLCSRIYFVSDLLAFATGAIIRIIRYSASAIARLPNLTLSLTYDFTVYAIAIAAALALILLMFGNSIKRKALIVILPSVLFAAIFSLCFTFYYVRDLDRAYVGFINYSKNDAFVIKDRDDIVICDIGDGSYSSLRLAAQLAKSEFHAYDIDAYMLTHYHQKHIYSFRRLAENYYIKTIFLPEPTNEKEKGIAEAIELSAKANYCDVIYYSSDEEGFVQVRGIDIYTQKREYINRSTHPLIAMRIAIGGHGIVYAGSSEFETKENYELFGSYLKMSEFLVIGAHGPVTKSPADRFGYMLPENVISSNSEMPLLTNIECDLSLDFANGDHVAILEIDK